MPQVSRFWEDMEKERQLSDFLDLHYAAHLKNYTFERIHDLKRQQQGIDLMFVHGPTGKRYTVDEKAQLDYLNEDLPTFAFELGYLKNGAPKEGWLFDARKNTEFYALITAIYTDAPHTFTSCKITFVNRRKLIFLLESRGIFKKQLGQYMENVTHLGAKMEIRELHPRNEGYLYFKAHKVEKPVNLVLKLDFLIENGVAKRLV